MSSSWRVFSPQLVEHDAKRDPYEVITADQKFVSNGVLQFLNVIPEPPAAPITLCAHPMGGIKTCVRVEGHTGKHMDKLKPKYVKPKMIGIRDFNAGFWAEVELIV